MSAQHFEIRPFEERDRVPVMSMATRLLIGVAEWRDRAVADEAVVGFVTTGTRPHWAGEVDAYVGELIVHERATGGGRPRAHG